MNDKTTSHQSLKCTASNDKRRKELYTKVRSSGYGSTYKPKVVPRSSPSEKYDSHKLTVKTHPRISQSLTATSRSTTSSTTSSSTSTTRKTPSPPTPKGPVDTSMTRSVLTPRSTNLQKMTPRSISSNAMTGDDEKVAINSNLSPKSIITSPSSLSQKTHDEKVKTIKPTVSNITQKLTSSTNPSSSNRSTINRLITTAHSDIAPNIHTFTGRSMTTNSNNNNVYIIPSIENRMTPNHDEEAVKGEDSHSKSPICVQNYLIELCKDEDISESDTSLFVLNPNNVEFETDSEELTSYHIGNIQSQDNIIEEMSTQSQAKPDKNIQHDTVRQHDIIPIDNLNTTVNENDKNADNRVPDYQDAAVVNVNMEKAGFKEIIHKDAKIVNKEVLTDKPVQSIDFVTNVSKVEEAEDESNHGIINVNEKAVDYEIHKHLGAPELDIPTDSSVHDTWLSTSKTKVPYNVASTETNQLKVDKAGDESMDEKADYEIHEDGYRSDVEKSVAVGEQELDISTDWSLKNDAWSSNSGTRDSDYYNLINTETNLLENHTNENNSKVDVCFNREEADYESYEPTIELEISNALGALELDTSSDWSLLNNTRESNGVMEDSDVVTTETNQIEVDEAEDESNSGIYFDEEEADYETYDDESRNEINISSPLEVLELDVTIDLPLIDERESNSNTEDSDDVVTNETNSLKIDETEDESNGDIDFDEEEDNYEIYDDASKTDYPELDISIDLSTDLSLDDTESSSSSLLSVKQEDEESFADFSMMMTQDEYIDNVLADYGLSLSKLRSDDNQVVVFLGSLLVSISEKQKRKMRRKKIDSSVLDKSDVLFTIEEEEEEIIESTPSQKTGCPKVSGRGRLLSYFRRKKVWDYKKIKFH